MVLVPAGEFLMGSEGGEGDDDEKPAHKVRLSAFCMDRTEVTQKSYESLMGANPAKFKGPDRPVESLAWSAAAKYCNMRSRKEGLTPCYDPKTLACDFAADGYRLPTEAEWEYACRAGSAGEYCYGNNPAALGEWAWSKENSQGATHPAGQKKPNAWGLCDMHGNVAEWCQDFYSPQAYGESPADDPRGPASGENRVLRGGSWKSKAERCRCAARAGESPGLADACFGYEAYGFRCVRKAPAEAK
jgi:formylglycine-generating enzyme required for sulfatase activity